MTMDSHFSLDRNASHPSPDTPGKNQAFTAFPKATRLVSDVCQEGGCHFRLLWKREPPGLHQEAWFHRRHPKLGSLTPSLFLRNTALTHTSKCLLFQPPLPNGLFNKLRLCLSFQEGRGGESRSGSHLLPLLQKHLC